MNSEYEFIVATPAIFIRRGEVENVMGHAMKMRVLMWEQRSFAATSWSKLGAARGTVVPRAAPTLPPRPPFSSAVVRRTEAYKTSDP
jgi:hypothetical protein